MRLQTFTIMIASACLTAASTTCGDVKSTFQHVGCCDGEAEQADSFTTQLAHLELPKRRLTVGDRQAVFYTSKPNAPGPLLINLLGWSVGIDVGFAAFDTKNWADAHNGSALVLSGSWKDKATLVGWADPLLELLPITEDRGAWDYTDPAKEAAFVTAAYEAALERVAPPGGKFSKVIVGGASNGGQIIFNFYNMNSLPFVDAYACHTGRINPDSATAGLQPTHSGTVPFVYIVAEGQDLFVSLERSSAMLDFFKTNYSLSLDTASTLPPYTAGAIFGGTTEVLDYKHASDDKRFIYLKNAAPQFTETWNHGIAFVAFPDVPWPHEPVIGTKSSELIEYDDYILGKAKMPVFGDVATYIVKHVL